MDNRCQHCGSTNVDIVHDWCKSKITCRDCKKETIEENDDDFSIEEMFDDMDFTDILDSEDLDPEMVKEVFKVIDEKLVVENVDTFVDSIINMMDNSNKRKE